MCNSPARPASCCTVWPVAATLALFSRASAAMCVTWPAMPLLECVCSWQMRSSSFGPLQPGFASPSVPRRPAPRRATRSARRTASPPAPSPRAAAGHPKGATGTCPRCFMAGPPWPYTCAHTSASSRLPPLHPALTCQRLSVVDIEGEVFLLDLVEGAVLVDLGQRAVDGLLQLDILLAQADGSPYAQRFGIT